MAKGDTKTNQYLDIAANGTRADLPTDTCCETRSQTLIREVAERIMDVEDEVEELKNSPDVVDIVATYADLQAYDTQHLTDKDIIRVLQDETHDGESTYYRYNKQSDTWTYVGTVGDYYTKTAADAKFQDKLTAGSNITISDQNVISATDTTYSNFTGTDGTTAGTAGLVPAPTTTDGDKYLKGDGTWGTVQAGSSYTAGDGINISAQDVISATNTGKARVLTTADYNWPTTGTKTAVAPYLLEPGLYFAGSNVSLQIGGTGLSGGTFLVGANGGSIKKVLLFGSTDGSISSMTLTGFNLDSSGRVISKEFIINIEDSLTSSRADFALSAKQGKVLKDLIDSLAIRGAGAPTTTTAGQVGTLYEDTTNGKLYICTDATNPYVWEEVGAGGGSGPTVVQTTGTSTTDVMSQNAVTSMVFADPSTKARVKIGAGASISNSGSLAIGNNAVANNYGSAAIGAGTASAYYTVSLFTQKNIDKPGSIGLGQGAKVTRNGEMNIGDSTGYYAHKGSNYRILSGLYDPEEAHDAATKGYVDPTTDSSAPTTATVGRLGQIQIDTTNNDAYMCVAADDVTPAYTWKKITV